MVSFNLKQPGFFSWLRWPPPNLKTIRVKRPGDFIHVERPQIIRKDSAVPAPRK